MRALVLLTILPTLLGGCGLLTRWFAHKPKPDPDAGKKDVFIGVVEIVNPEQHFVLVRTGMKLNLQAGWILETRPTSGTKSVLTVSPEQKLNFLSADITAGIPQKGEIVVMPPQVAAAPPGEGTPGVVPFVPAPPLPAP